ncbi:MAG: NAD(P)/FAD-dependent oxidoreductase [Thermoplasmata archaeon]|nr:NAD(P)/FAD-dependent oxidoreductase [Thermoplasmata archaeon]WII07457.1 NAD(P)/FAD-dependent oxidoreductase [Methanomassiliicoccales archaeon LGM-RCC1]
MSYDVVIIGAGPAGLTAGIYARSKGMETLLLDSGRVGGQLVSLYPEKGIHNYPGFETIQARKLSDKLYAQAESMGCDIRENEKVEEINNGEEELIVVTAKGEYHAKSVIIAIGMGSFKPKKMGCPGEDELFGKGVTYILPAKEELVGKKITMFGGGNSAIDMALIANSVAETTLVHRRAEFRADESTVKELTRSDVKTIMSANLVSINGKDSVESVTLDQEGKQMTIPTDMVVINIGISADLDDLKKWGIELTEDGLVKVGFDMSTNRPGVFACGDVVSYEGKYKQITTACGEATTAMMMAYKFVKKPYWA